MNNTFKKAAKIDLFDADGKLRPPKGIVNADNTSEYFNTVSDGYNIVQHQDVIDLVNDTIEDKNYNVNMYVDDFKNGARIHMVLTFPDIKLDVENNGQSVCLRCTYDNSYDGSTGLRLEIGAQSPYGAGFLWVGGLVRALEDNYYHRHTKGVDVAKFEKSLSKGIVSFETKIKDHFKDMFNTPITSSEALSFLEDKVLGTKNISNIYVEAIITAIKRTTLKNKWQLYCIICDTISSEASSVDVRNRHLAAIVGKLHKSFYSKRTGTPSNGGGGIVKPTNVIPLITNTAPQRVLHTCALPDLRIKLLKRNRVAVMNGDKMIKKFSRSKKARRYIAKFGERHGSLVVE